MRQAPVCERRTLTPTTNPPVAAAENHRSRSRDDGATLQESLVTTSQRRFL